MPLEGLMKLPEPDAYRLYEENSLMEHMVSLRVAGRVAKRVFVVVVF